ncbi:MAG: hypothetical protein WA864_00010 [Acetobacteraceae bacterium]|jgi:hypothetical protein
MPDCDSPYLEHHHFDPPWEPSHQHRLDGMIALCAKHHGLADGGNFTKRQLADWKAKARQRPLAAIRETVHMKRDRVIFRMGGAMAFCCPTILLLHGTPAIWLTSDSDGSDLLNLTIRDANGSIVFEMEDNDWTAHPVWDDVEVPPMGRSIKIVARKLGIDLSLAFKGITAAVARSYIGPDPSLTDVTDDELLLCEMEGQLVWPTPVRFTPTKMMVGGAHFMRVNIVRCNVAFAIA